MGWQRLWVSARAVSHAHLGRWWAGRVNGVWGGNMASWHCREHRRRRRRPLDPAPLLPPRAALSAALAADGVSLTKPVRLAGALQPPPPPPPISKSDEAFLEGGVEFAWGAAGVELGELNDLFHKVGFPRRDPERLGLALRNTHRTLSIRAGARERVTGGRAASRQARYLVAPSLSPLQRARRGCAARARC